MIQSTQQSKLLEKSSLKKVFISVRLFCNYTRQTVLLPYLAYIVFGIYRLFQTSLPLLLTDNDRVRATNPPVGNIFQLFQFLWRFSSPLMSYNDFMNSFIAIVSLYVILFVFDILIFVLFLKKGRISNMMCLYVCSIHEIIFPILASWTISQFASVLSQCLNDKEYHSIFIYLQIAVYALIIICHYYFQITFLNNDVSYMKGRSSMWSSRISILCYMTTDAVLLLTRLIELLPTIPTIIFSVLLGLILIYEIINFYYVPSFINTGLKSIFLSAIIACYAGFLIQLISFYVYSFDLMIVLLVVMAVFVIFFIVNQHINNTMLHRSFHILDLLSNGDISFEDSFKNSKQFLFAVCLGFQHGNFYVLSWQPFVSALSAWPDDLSVWIQLIRFLAVYTDQSRRLDQVLGEFMDKKFKGQHSKNIISQVKIIQNSRNSHLTREIKHTLKLLDEKTAAVKNQVDSYWNEIKSGTSNAAYNVAEQLNQMMDSIQAEYLHIVSKWPNCSVIAAKYSFYLLNIQSNPKEAQLWANRAQFLKDKNRCQFDSSQECGFECFPLLPPAITDPSNEITESPYSTKDNLTISTQSSYNDFSFSTTTEIILEENENIQSNILKLGQESSLPFISRLYIVIALFFIISFVLIPFVPPTYVISTFISYSKIFRAVKSIADVHYSFSKIQFLTLFHALEHENLLSEKLYSRDIEEILDQELDHINSDLNYFHSCYGNEIKLASRSGDMIKNSIIEFTLPDCYYNVTLFEGLNSLCESFLKIQSVGDASFISEVWMSFAFASSENMHSFLNELLDNMCEDMIIERTGNVNNVFIIVVVALVLEFLLIPVFIGFILRIRTNWDFIIENINTIPQIGIQKTTQKYSQSYENLNEKDKNTFKAESRYQNTFVEMISSRNISGGLPIRPIILIYIFNLALSLICCTAILLMVNSLKASASSLPSMYHNSANIAELFYNLCSLLLIKISVDSDIEFMGLTRDTYIDYIKVYQNFLPNIINSFLFGSQQFEGTGALSSSASVVDKLLIKHGDTFELDTQEIGYFPFIASIDFMEEIFDTIYWKIVTDPNYNVLQNPEHLWTFINFTVNNIIPLIVDEFLDDYSGSFENETNQANSLFFIIAVILFIIGIISVGWLLYMISHVKMVIRFVLSSLSMVDPVYYQEMQNVMNLFYGKLSESIPSNQKVQNTFTKAENIIPELVIELDYNLCIVSFNDNVIKEWKLDGDQVLGSNLKYIISFDDECILKNMEKQAWGEDGVPKCQTYNTTVTVNSTKEKYNITFFANSAVRSDRTKLVILISSFYDITTKKKQIEQLNYGNNAIKASIVPRKLQDKFDIEANKLSFKSNYLIFAAINIMNFDDFTSNHTAKESRAFFRKFIGHITEQCNNTEIDAVYVKNIGSTLIVVFNILRQSSSYYKSGIEAYEFLCETRKYASENGYDIRGSLGNSKNTLTSVGSMGNLNFDVRSKIISTLLILLFGAKKNQLIFPPKVKKFMPMSIAENTKGVEIEGANNEKEYAFVLPLN